MLRIRNFPADVDVLRVGQWDCNGQNQGEPVLFSATHTNLPSTHSLYLANESVRQLGGRRSARDSAGQRFQTLA
jgi:hypothetical protein